MNHLQLIRRRLADGLATIVDDPAPFAAMVRPTADPAHGDYQINAAMSLSAEIGNRDRTAVAQMIIDATKLDDLCNRVEIAGPGFINLHLDDDAVLQSLHDAMRDSEATKSNESMKARGRVLIDYSSPNVAKPMHVGHIRSTVIGDALAAAHRAAGYDVITDNHLGDWGTQFGIIIYGFKHFVNPDALAANPVPELSRLYRKVQSIISHHDRVDRFAAIGDDLSSAVSAADEKSAAVQTAIEASEKTKTIKKLEKAAASASKRVSQLQSERLDLEATLSSAAADPEAAKIHQQHADVRSQVLAETAKLHSGDAENLELWNRFLPHCRDEIDRVYRRLNVQFDHTLGESFYHDRLSGIVDRLQKENLAKRSDGAMCVFVDGFDTPMIIQKSDDAYLYATTDLATLQYRLSQFQPTRILYVVDTRQGEHFKKLFAVAKQIGWTSAELLHVNFGTVLGADGKPMKTRSGDLIGLEGLLNDAVEAAKQVVCDPQRLQRFDPPMDDDEQSRVAEAVGIGAVKFADLSHERTSDYKFDLSKMVALEGNTSVYIQYQTARTASILRRIGTTEDEVWQRIKSTPPASPDPDFERPLVIALSRFDATLDAVCNDCAPNLLADYLIQLARSYARFNDNCSVKDAPDESTRSLRLALVVASGRTMRRGLEILGIQPVDRM